MALTDLAPVLKRSLSLMSGWFQGMTEPTRGLLRYAYDPAKHIAIEQPSPIRFLGTAADLGLLQQELGSAEFDSVISNTLRLYVPHLVEVQPPSGEAGGQTIWLQPLRLSSQGLQEPSNIAHSALMINALAHWQPSAVEPEAVAQAAGTYRSPAAAERPFSTREERHRLMEQLADGILSQQRPDGTYIVYFDRQEEDVGWELYAGEAMLALLETAKALATTGTGASSARHLASVEAAFPAYAQKCTVGRAVAPQLLVFFANWMMQAARLLVEQTASSGLASSARSFTIALHDALISEDVALFARAAAYPTEASTVEVACGLEGLADAYSLLCRFTPYAEATADPGRKGRYEQAICQAVSFLERVQVKPPPPPTAAAAAAPAGAAGVPGTESVHHAAAPAGAMAASGASAAAAAGTSSADSASALGETTTAPAQQQQQVAEGQGGGGGGTRLPAATWAARPDDPAIGGFGHALHVPTQRIDVTGHVASAYIKLLHVL